MGGSRVPWYEGTDEPESRATTPIVAIALIVVGVLLMGKLLF